MFPEVTLQRIPNADHAFHDTQLAYTAFEHVTSQMDHEGIPETEETHVSGSHPSEDPQC